MIHPARWIALLVMAGLPGPLGAAPLAAYDLVVENGPAGVLRLRLHVEMGGKPLLRLDAQPAAHPHGEVLTCALVQALDRNRDGKLSREELRVAEEVLLEKDADEDECITPFELAPSLLTDAPPPRPRSSPRVSLSLAGKAKPDREFTLHVDTQRCERVLEQSGSWLIDVCTQPGRSDGAKALYRQTADSLVTLTVSTRPRSWFALLDSNSDGQLSRKELRCAWERLADTGARKRRFVTAPSWTAPVLTLTFMRGLHTPADTPLRKRPARPRGPSWFTAMDRNGDGYLSSAEFIGTRSQFRKMDRDGDGLVDPDEAEGWR